MALGQGGTMGSCTTSGFGNISRGVRGLRYTCRHATIEGAEHGKGLVMT